MNALSARFGLTAPSEMECISTLMNLRKQAEMNLRKQAEAFKNAHCMGSKFGKGSGGDAGGMPEKRVPKRYPCSYEGCEKSFTHAASLASHVRAAHTGERPFVCSYPNCGKAFARRGSLTIHHRIHTGEKAYVCTYEGCRASFSTSSSLSKHMNSHFGSSDLKQLYEGRMMSKSRQIWTKLSLNRKGLGRSHHSQLHQFDADVDTDVMIDVRENASVPPAPEVAVGSAPQPVSSTTTSLATFALPQNYLPVFTGASSSVSSLSSISSLSSRSSLGSGAFAFGVRPSPHQFGGAASSPSSQFTSLSSRAAQEDALESAALGHERLAAQHFYVPEHRADMV